MRYNELSLVGEIQLQSNRRRGRATLLRAENLAMNTKFDSYIDFQRAEGKLQFLFRKAYITLLTVNLFLTVYFINVTL